MSTFTGTDRLLDVHFCPFNCEWALMFLRPCEFMSNSVSVQSYLSVYHLDCRPYCRRRRSVYVYFPCARVCVCVSAHVHGLFPCCRLLERITSFKEYEIQHLLKSDTLWHCFEAMKVRLERHGSSFLSAELWVYVIASRPVKFPLKRHAPEGEDKAAT